MISQKYNRVVAQLARGYKLVMKYDRSDIKLKMKAISVMLMIDLLDRHIPS